jgi:hypothetical protein
MDDVKTYEIGGATYEQRRPVLGQLLQLSTLLTSVPEGVMKNAEDFAQVLGEMLPEFLAVVLTPQGVRLTEKDTPALAATLAETCPGAVAQEAVRDFFDWPNLAEELVAAGTARNALGAVVAATRRESAGENCESTSSDGPCSSAGATSQSASACCGPCGETKSSHG